MSANKGPAMQSCLDCLHGAQLLPHLLDAVDKSLKLQQSTYAQCANNPDEGIVAEFFGLSSFWVHPQNYRILQRHSQAHLMAFSLAVGAVLAKNFGCARMMIRTGLVMRELQKPGKTLFHAIASNFTERVKVPPPFEFSGAILETGTNRGCIAFLRRETQCAPDRSFHCLDELCGEDDATRKCVYCWKQDEKRQFRKCGDCRSVRYCGPDCQTSDWPRHKQECSKAKPMAASQKPTEICSGVSK